MNIENNSAAGTNRKKMSYYKFFLCTTKNAFNVNVSSKDCNIAETFLHTGWGSDCTSSKHSAYDSLYSS